MSDTKSNEEHIAQIRGNLEKARQALELLKKMSDERRALSRRLVNMTIAALFVTFLFACAMFVADKYATGARAMAPLTYELPAGMGHTDDWVEAGRVRFYDAYVWINVHDAPPRGALGEVEIENDGNMRYYRTEVAGRPGRHLTVEAHWTSHKDHPEWDAYAQKRVKQLVATLAATPVAP